ncbi:INTS1 [Cordylochernes scorpioides]|uniref:INTS1 n=1 Tax=Cordylochernes scorpioides TaxID=51811 RepID=A0ABY6KVF1_9ARAC|nr:INTS1 [Cordylochernes scorpioides]
MCEALGLLIVDLQLGAESIHRLAQQAGARADPVCPTPPTPDGVWFISARPEAVPPLLAGAPGWLAHTPLLSPACALVVHLLTFVDSLNCSFFLCSNLGYECLCQWVLFQGRSQTPPSPSLHASPQPAAAGHSPRVHRPAPRPLLSTEQVLYVPLIPARERVENSSSSPLTPGVVVIPVELERCNKFSCRVWCQLDMVSHAVILALANNHPGDRMAEVVCRKLAAVHPLLFLRQLGMLSSLLRGRIEARDFSIFRSRGQLALFLAVLSVVELLGPALFASPASSEILACYLDMCSVSAPSMSLPLWWEEGVSSFQ